MATHTQTLSDDNSPTTSCDIINTIHLDHVASTHYHAFNGPNHQQTTTMSIPPAEVYLAEDFVASSLKVSTAA